ncbi:MAG: hypothetical protein ACPGWR_16720 [Ardenticatenaceae bacterium]
MQRFTIGGLNYNQFVASPVVDWSSLVHWVGSLVGSSRCSSSLVRHRWFVGLFVGLVHWFIHGVGSLGCSLTGEATS